MGYEEICLACNGSGEVSESDSNDQHERYRMCIPCKGRGYIYKPSKVITPTEKAEAAKTRADEAMKKAIEAIERVKQK